MSRLDEIDVASLRARLYWAIDAKQGEPSLYLHCLGACFLACNTDEEEERLEELFFGQARFELVDGAQVLATLTLAGGAS